MTDHGTFCRELRDGLGVVRERRASLRGGQRVPVERDGYDPGSGGRDSEVVVHDRRTHREPPRSGSLPVQVGDAVGGTDEQRNGLAAPCLRGVRVPPAIRLSRAVLDQDDRARLDRQDVTVARDDHWIVATGEFPGSDAKTPRSSG